MHAGMHSLTHSLLRCALIVWNNCLVLRSCESVCGGVGRGLRHRNIAYRLREEVEEEEDDDDDNVRTKRKRKAKRKKWKRKKNRRRKNW